MKNLFKKLESKVKNLSNTFALGGVVLIGILIGVCLNGISNSEPEKEVSIFTNTLVLENQGEVDLYGVDGGKWLVISLDDLKYIVKKKRKTIVSDLESLFERFEVPKKNTIKPTFK